MFSANKVVVPLRSVILGGGGYLKVGIRKKYNYDSCPDWCGRPPQDCVFVLGAKC